MNMIVWYARLQDVPYWFNFAGINRQAHRLILNDIPVLHVVCQPIIDILSKGRIMKIPDDVIDSIYPPTGEWAYYSPSRDEWFDKEGEKLPGIWDIEFKPDTLI